MSPETMPVSNEQETEKDKKPTGGDAMKISMEMETVIGPSRKVKKVEMGRVPGQSDSLAGKIGYNYNIPKVKRAGEQRETKTELTPQETNFINKAKEIFAQRFMALKGNIAGSDTAFSGVMNSPEGKKVVEASLSIFKDEIKKEKIVASKIVELRSELAAGLMEIYKTKREELLSRKGKMNLKSTLNQKPKPKPKTGFSPKGVLGGIVNRMWQ